MKMALSLANDFKHLVVWENETRTNPMGEEEFVFRTKLSVLKRN